VVEAFSFQHREAVDDSRNAALLSLWSQRTLLTLTIDGPEVFNVMR